MASGQKFLANHNFIFLKSVKWPKKVANWPKIFTKVASKKPRVYAGLRAFAAKRPFFFTIKCMRKKINITIIDEKKWPIGQKV